MSKRSLKAKIEASIDAQMKEMIEKQEAWMEKMTLVIEGKEEERLLREEQWRKQDAARIDGEQKMWASERAWGRSPRRRPHGRLQQIGGKTTLPATSSAAAVKGGWWRDVATAEEWDGIEVPRDWDHDGGIRVGRDGRRRRQR